MNNVIKTVNFIKKHALNGSHFKLFLQESESLFEDDMSEGFREDKQSKGFSV